LLIGEQLRRRTAAPLACRLSREGRSCVVVVRRGPDGRSSGWLARESGGSRGRRHCQWLRQLLGHRRGSGDVGGARAPARLRPRRRWATEATGAALTGRGGDGCQWRCAALRGARKRGRPARGWRAAALGASRERQRETSAVGGEDKRETGQLEWLARMGEGDKRMRPAWSVETERRARENIFFRFFSY
jgi:hypothetical protein